MRVRIFTHKTNKYVKDTIRYLNHVLGDGYMFKVTDNTEAFVGKGIVKHFNRNIKSFMDFDDI